MTRYYSVIGETRLGVTFAKSVLSLQQIIEAMRWWDDCVTVGWCLFINFHLPSVVSARGVTYLFDIQVKAFNSVYDGEDVIAQARTGTGKTFSFAIPLLEKLQQDSTPLCRGRPPKVNTHLHSGAVPVPAAVWVCVCFDVGARVDSNQRVGHPGC